jgi:cytochrome c2
MWKAMADRNIAGPRLAPNEISDLYAYFFALRYFEPPGDAARGKNVFVGKGCNRCHALVATETGGVGPPVGKWGSLEDPLLFIQNMWNHGSRMASEITQSGGSWPRFETREMADLIVYVQNLPGLPPRAPKLRLGQSSAGEQVFDSHQCLNCHTFGAAAEGVVDLSAVSRREASLTGLAVAMWNHRPLMETAAAQQRLEMKPFEEEEMAELVAYLFEENFFDEPGDSEAGDKLFASKGCAGCHGQAGTNAPQLRGTGGGYTSPTFSAAIWRHGPAMAAEFERQGKQWPTLTDRDVANIIARLNVRE